MKRPSLLLTFSGLTCATHGGRSDSKLRPGMRSRREPDEEGVSLTDEPLKSGQFVRYLETTTRWYFARVRRLRDEEIELSFFDGSAPLKVHRAQVESLEAFLSERERTWSRTRSQLTGFFYGREFERLRENRFREIQRTFRKAGISFHPKDWPIFLKAGIGWCRWRSGFSKNGSGDGTSSHRRSRGR